MADKLEVSIEVAELDPAVKVLPPLPISLCSISLWKPGSFTRDFWVGWHNVPKAPGQTLFAPKWGGPAFLRRILKEDVDTIVKEIEAWYSSQQPGFEYKLEILTVTIA